MQVRKEQDHKEILALQEAREILVLPGRLGQPGFLVARAIPEHKVVLVILG